MLWRGLVGVGCAGDGCCGRRMGESGSQTGRGGVTERGGAWPGCGLKEDTLMVMYAGGGCALRRSRVLERESGVEDYGAATLRRQTKQTGARDMSQGSVGAAVAGERSKDCERRRPGW